MRCQEAATEVSDCLSPAEPFHHFCPLPAIPHPKVSMYNPSLLQGSLLMEGLHIGGLGLLGAKTLGLFLNVHLQHSGRPV